MKKIVNIQIFTTLLLFSAISSTYAQNNSQAGINKCSVQNGISYCAIESTGRNIKQIQPIKVTNTTQIMTETPPQYSNIQVDNTQSGNIQSLNAPLQIPQGKYSDKVPGGNVFLFCGAGRPSKANPLRVVYDSICAGNTGTQGQSQVFSATPQQQPISADQQPIFLTPATNVNKRINTKAESYNDPIQLLK